ncbi:hypothetical protein XENTR_v10013408 [Xenopus tropicalis]|nr:hypothetical protein XENTR_v10013408 [Xenopus tropicalis]
MELEGTGGSPMCPCLAVQQLTLCNMPDMYSSHPTLYSAYIPHSVYSTYPTLYIAHTQPCMLCITHSVFGTYPTLYRAYPTLYVVRTPLCI